MKSSDLQVFKFILLIFLVWKGILILISLFGFSFLPIRLGENQFSIATLHTDYWAKWANWDGGHFRGIAVDGYLKPFQVVFFPLYPLAIAGLMNLKINSLFSGILISNLSTILGLFYLYKLVKLDFNDSIAKKTIFITLAFPTAFYFNAVYSEGLFLFLTVSSFFYARQKNWVLAFLLAGLAAGTRLVGLVVIFSVFAEYYLKTIHPPTLKQFWSEFLNRIAVYLLLIAVLLTSFRNILINNKLYLLDSFSKSIPFFLTITALLLLLFFAFKFLMKNFDFKKILTFPTLLFFLSLIPFLGYCFYLFSTHNDFFAFITYESHWERQLTFPWSATINYFFDLLNLGFIKPAEGAQKLIELIFFILFGVTFIFTYLRFRFSYTIYFVLSLILPLCTGTLQAIHRYGLVIFPIFIVLALIKNETIYQVWMYFSLTLLGVFTVLYINGYWVS